MSSLSKTAITVTTVAFAGVSLVTSIHSANAGVAGQGTHMQGTYLQGTYLQGTYLQGTFLQGTYLQGTYLQGTHLQGTHLQGTYMQGTNLQGTYMQGTELEGAGFVGVEMMGELSDGRAVNVRITDAQLDTSTNTSIYPDNSDILLYKLQVADGPLWQDACPNGGWGMFFEGEWNSLGEWTRLSQVDAEFNHDNEYEIGVGLVAARTTTTFACVDTGVIAKCARNWGYKPWTHAVDAHGQYHDEVQMRRLHQACTRAARADYCATADSFTVNGTLIDVYDPYGFNTAEALDFRFEAEFVVLPNKDELVDEGRKKAYEASFVGHTRYRHLQAVGTCQISKTPGWPENRHTTWNAAAKPEHDKLIVKVQNRVNDIDPANYPLIYNAHDPGTMLTVYNFPDLAYNETIGVIRVSSLTVGASIRADVACDYDWVGTDLELSCPLTWENDGWCDAGCQFSDQLDCLGF